MILEMKKCYNLTATWYEINEERYNFIQWGAFIHENKNTELHDIIQISYFV
jgi:hypothetical protein